MSVKISWCWEFPAEHLQWGSMPLKSLANGCWQFDGLPTPTLASNTHPGCESAKRANEKLVRGDQAILQSCEHTVRRHGRNRAMAVENRKQQWSTILILQQHCVQAWTILIHQYPEFADVLTFKQPVTLDPFQNMFIYYCFCRHLSGRLQQEASLGRMISQWLFLTSALNKWGKTVKHSSLKEYAS